MKNRSSTYDINRHKYKYTKYKILIHDKVTQH